MIDQRFEALDHRFDALEHRLQASFHREITRVVRWTVPTIFAGGPRSARSSRPQPDTATNPKFFVGTVVEDACRAEVNQPA